MFRILLLSIVLILFLSSCKNSNSNFETILPSPDSRKHLYFNLNGGEPYYLLYFEDNILVDWSKLGLVLDDTNKFNEGLRVNDAVTRTSSHDNEFMFPGVKTDLPTFNEITISLEKQNSPDILLSLVMRIYDNAVAFKYKISFDGEKKTLSEITELDFYKDIISEVLIINGVGDESSTIAIPAGQADTLLLPATFMSEKNYKLEYKESLSQDYPVMKLLKRASDNDEFKMKYADDTIENIIVVSGFETPWRIIYITESKI